MLRKTLLMTLGSCLLAVLLSMTASCSDADFVKPDQVDARVDARWNELSKSLTEKVLANELAIAQLNSMLTALQQEHDDAYNKLQDMLQNFATKDYADYQAEQARLSAIDAAMALIADALANLTGTGEYQDLSGILDDIDKLKEADSLLSIRVMNVEAKITAVGISLSNYYTKAEIDALFASYYKRTYDEIASYCAKTKEELLYYIEEKYYEILNSLDKYCTLDNLETVYSTLSDSITSINERQKNALKELYRLDAEIKTHDARLTSLDSTTWALSQRLDQLENRNDSLYSEVAKNYQYTLQLHDELAMFRVEMEERLAMNVKYLEDSINELKTTMQDLWAMMDEFYSSLYRRMDQLVTSVVYQAQKYDYVNGSGNIVFPYAGAYNADYLQGGSYNIQEKAGFIYATINPSDIDATRLGMTLENSMDAKSYYLTPVPEEAEPATDLRLTRASSPNGLWKIPVRSIAHTGKDPYDDAVETDMLLALKATYWWGEKSVYSQYAATWEGPKPAEVATSANMEADGNNYYSLLTSNGIRFSSEQSLNDSTLRGRLLLQSGDTRVYRKYIECVQVRDINKRDITDSLRTVINERNADFHKVLRTQDDGSADRVNVVCPRQLMNNYCTLRYYLWNYDGTIASQDLVVIFSDDETL